jgi:hypothetical protein
MMITLTPNDPASGTRNNNEHIPGSYLTSASIPQEEVNRLEPMAVVLERRKKKWAVPGSYFSVVF